MARKDMAERPNVESVLVHERGNVLEWHDLECEPEPSHSAAQRLVRDRPVEFWQGARRITRPSRANDSGGPSSSGGTSA